MRTFLALSLVLVSATPALAQEEAGKEPQLLEMKEGKEYGDQGTFELGGTIAASVLNSVSTFSASPTFGYFIIDHLELTAELGIAYTRIQPSEGVGPVATSKSIVGLIEPSWHQPIADNLQVLMGLGIGGSWDGDNTDFDLVPHFGLNIVTSRSAVITPGVTVPIMIGKGQGSNGGTGVDAGLQFEVGITTTW